MCSSARNVFVDLFISTLNCETSEPSINTACCTYDIDEYVVVGTVLDGRNTSDGRVLRAVTNRERKKKGKRGRRKKSGVQNLVLDTRRTQRRSVFVPDRVQAAADALDSGERNTYRTL
jgi:hypothetical protein